MISCLNFEKYMNYSTDYVLSRYVYICQIRFLFSHTINNNDKNQQCLIMMSKKIEKISKQNGKKISDLTDILNPI
jgi:hypothetical protein